ncbi:uncharacterized protein LOC107040105 [Diachasma alloeum]|uniref:uncharacterized protein LOC107040105 n=1 Tax=Diachasma alloeum TaxID=454923 RepID=UPI0007381B59|nr:uncharacterized protein LOC107040105 [Diachasma alloeum]
MEESLNIKIPPVFEESIAHYEIHAHQPYASTGLDNSDEIRITVQNQDLCILPSKSHLHITGKLLKADNTKATLTTLVNNAICHLFQEIRYEINAIEIDKVKNVGITTLMKNLISLTPNQNNSMENAGWLGVQEELSLVDDGGRFDVSVPLSMLLGFAEDYRKIMINVKHELVLIRAHRDNNAIVQLDKEDVKVTLSKIEWLIPYVTLSDTKKIQLLNFIQKDPPIPISFRSWELYEYPMLPQTTKHVWTWRNLRQRGTLGRTKMLKEKKLSEAEKFEKQKEDEILQEIKTTLKFIMGMPLLPLQLKADQELLKRIMRDRSNKAKKKPGPYLGYFKKN